MYTIDNKYIVDGNTNTLKLNSNGEVIQIGRQDFNVLWVLCDHAGEVVSKESLLNSAWEGKIVSQSSLTQSIKNIRQYLGDTGRTQKYIKTVSGKGYLLNIDCITNNDVDESFSKNPLPRVAEDESFGLSSAKLIPYIKSWKWHAVMTLIVVFTINTAFTWLDYSEDSALLSSLKTYKSGKLTIHSDYIISGEELEKDKALLNKIRHAFLYIHKDNISISIIKLDGQIVNKLYKTKENNTANMAIHLFKEELNNA
ncbi:winged helix-turn-helix domain-containing protein [Vibrio sp. SCSIO 43135]|uniref:winged helix-turn-helix domain-containing protein n=1 Tax=Vibrio sp. SCSIO 43135 TaxID=2819096 RepID=UPI00207515D1|nr:winged helix-turn-helix domain-containing protein [Vibrio sp. SCSIO 43135]USD40080.1 winged helix-turn-helix domain-containing protein [Vibrio sp. SCSIO 43135]